MPSPSPFLHLMGMQTTLNSPGNDSLALSQQRELSTFSCDKYLSQSSLVTFHLWCCPGSPLDICFNTLLPVSGGKLGVLICKGVLFTEARVPLWLSCILLSVSGNVICMIDVNKWVEWCAISSLWIISFSLFDWQICRFLQSWHFQWERKKWVPGCSWLEACSGPNVTIHVGNASCKRRTFSFPGCAFIKLPFASPTVPVPLLLEALFLSFLSFVPERPSQTSWKSFGKWKCLQLRGLISRDPRFQISARKWLQMLGAWRWKILTLGVASGSSKQGGNSHKTAAVTAECTGLTGTWLRLASMLPPTKLGDCGFWPESLLHPCDFLCLIVNYLSFSHLPFSLCQWSDSKKSAGTELSSEKQKQNSAQCLWVLVHAACWRALGLVTLGSLLTSNLLRFIFFWWYIL